MDSLHLNFLPIFLFFFSQLSFLLFLLKSDEIWKSSENANSSLDDKSIALIAHISYLTEQIIQSLDQGMDKAWLHSLSENSSSDWIVKVFLKETSILVTNWVLEVNQTVDDDQAGKSSNLLFEGGLLSLFNLLLEDY